MRVQRGDVVLLPIVNSPRLNPAIFAPLPWETIPKSYQRMVHRRMRTTITTVRLVRIGYAGRLKMSRACGLKSLTS
jgi:hypothetical protein